MDSIESQLEKVEIKDDLDQATRHCAFCLISVPSKEAKLCGGCLKRAYCSKDCQVSDWSLKKPGSQGHKNWCKLDCGEEDLDWDVRPVPGKGLGLIAKRPIPAKFRIIVDAIRPKSHPGLQDLMPLEGTIDQKYNLNALDCDTEGEDVLCLRIARANHSCSANADHYFDETFKVKILFSERDIKEGEEICTNYQPFNDVSKSRTAEFTRLILQVKWGIVCPPDCFCQDKELEKIVVESREYDSAIFSLGSQGQTDPALRAVNRLLENHEVMHSSLISKERTLYDGFQIAVTRKKTLKLAEKFIQQTYDIASSILSPKSAKCLMFEGYMKNMKTNSNYLRFQ